MNQQVDDTSTEMPAEEPGGAADTAPVRTFLGMTLKQLLLVGVVVVVVGVFAVLIVFRKPSVAVQSFQSAPEIAKTQPQNGIQTNWKQGLNQAAALTTHAAPASTPAINNPVQNTLPNQNIASPATANVAGPVTPAPAASTAIEALRTRLDSLQSTVNSQAAEIAQLNLQLQYRSGTDKELKPMRSRIASLEVSMQRLAELSHRMDSDLNSRPIFPGWSVAGITKKAAVLYGPNGAVQMISPGETFAGVRILSINTAQNKIYTSAGVLTWSQQ